jgi:uncharacterized membrane protein YdbT with pleckstrin-like domain
MAFLDAHIGTGENIIYRCRPSRKAFVFEYILFFIALIISIIVIYPLMVSKLTNTSTVILKSMGYILGIITLAILIKIEYKIWSKRYAITTQRIIVSEGIFSENFRSSVHEKITDIGLKQTLLDKILNTGTIYINTAGSDNVELTLEKISAPLTIKKQISDIYSHSRKTQENQHNIKHSSIIKHNTKHQGQHLNNRHPKIIQKR